MIESVRQQTARIRSVFLRVPGWQGHVAGQHVDLRLTAEDGYQARRSYSIASAPESPLVELVVERLDGGEVSPFLHDIAAPGDGIALRGPLGGHFTWSATEGGPLLLLAGGTGVVPLMSMLRHRALAAAGVPALLLLSARTWPDVPFQEELLARDRAEPALHVQFALTRETAHRAGDVSGRIDAAVLRRALTRLGPAAPRAYVCGATPFVEAATAALAGLLHDPARLKAERYGGATTNNQEVRPLA